MKKLLLSFSIFLLFAFGTIKAQVGINILQPDSNAILDLFSDEKGLLLPRLTTTQMTSMQNPTNGLVIYNTEDSLIYYYNNECWLKAYQKNCQECEFISSVNQGFATIDRTLNDTAYFEIDITKLNGTDSIATAVLASLPQGMSVTVENPIIDSVGTVIVKVYANIWAPPGTYPLIIQSVCGQNVYFQGVTVEVEPCILVNIAAPLQDVDLQTDFSLPGVGTPVCVVLDIAQNVEISATSTNDYAMSWGSLDPNSHVGLRNKGYIYAKGGNGANLTNLISNPSFAPPGEVGGDALELTCRTTFDLQGGVYSGGGGGGSVGGVVATPSLPIVGTLVILEAGVTGGGGASGGLAGNSPGSSGTVIGPSLLDLGTDATVGPTSIPGVGGILSYSTSFSAGPATVTPFVSLNGGDGGDFGQPGTSGAGSIGANVNVSVSIPIIGNITLLNQTFSYTLPISQGGAPGIAIKTNNVPTQDLVVPNFLITGPVQP
ncbi:MAG: hypothetical protein KDE33_15770 [Bacteroidetes bacterium]|nr:hypothetical protein [Bacteroidota bacterium]